DAEGEAVVVEFALASDRAEVVVLVDEGGGDAADLQGGGALLEGGDLSLEVASGDGEAVLQVLAHDVLRWGGLDTHTLARTRARVGDVETNPEGPSPCPTPTTSTASPPSAAPCSQPPERPPTASTPTPCRYSSPTPQTPASPT